MGFCAWKDGENGAGLDVAERRDTAIGASLLVDLFIPGCPSHPLTILDGLLRLLGRIG